MILVVYSTVWAVVSMARKIQTWTGIQTTTFAIPVQCANKLSYQGT